MYNVRHFPGVVSRTCVCKDHPQKVTPQGCSSRANPCAPAVQMPGTATDPSVSAQSERAPHPNQAPQLSNLMPSKDEVEAYLAKHKLSAILQESISELVKEGMPDNPLAVIASKLNAVGNPVRASAAANTRLPSEMHSFVRCCGRRTCPWPRRPSSCRWV